MNIYKDILKVLVIGEKNSGKTSLINSMFMEPGTYEDPEPTPNIAMYPLTLEYTVRDASSITLVKYKIHIYEVTYIDRPEKYKHIEFLLENSQAVFVCYNSLDKKNYVQAKIVIETLRSMKRKNTFGLIGTKCDLRTNEEYYFDTVKAYCNNSNFQICYELDAKHKKNTFLLDLIIENNEKKSDGQDIKKSNKKHKEYRCYKV